MLLSNLASRVLARCTALILAAMNGHTLVVEQLIAAGAALDVQNNEGYGPGADCSGFTLFQTGSRLLGRNAALILAAMKGHTPVVEKLTPAPSSISTESTELRELHSLSPHLRARVS